MTTAASVTSTGPATDSLKLTSYFGERQRCGTGFAADALLALYGRREIATSILLRGTEGFGLKHHLRTDRSLSLSEDLPLITVAVDTRPRITASTARPRCWAWTAPRTASASGPRSSAATPRSR